MNLCGGTFNTAEGEILIPSVLTSGSSDDDLEMTPDPRTTLSTQRRRKREGNTVIEVGLKAPSSRSKSRHQSSSIASSPGSPSLLLNPLSKEDLKKSRARQRPLGGPLNSLKTNSTVIKKLEAGFNVVLFSVNNSMGRKVLLNLESDRSQLRMSTLDNSSGKKSVSEGKDSKTPDTKVKVKDIQRLEVGRTKSSNDKSRSVSGGIQPIKSFSIVMKNIDGDARCLDIEAESLVERDAIISGLRILLDQTRMSASDIIRRIKSPLNFENSTRRASLDIDCPTGSLSPLKRTHIHCETPKAQKPGNGPTRTPRTPGDQGTETSLAYFDFDFADQPEGERARETTTTPKKNISSPFKETGNDDVKGTQKTRPSNATPMESSKSDSSGQGSTDDDDARDNSIAAAEDNDIRDKHVSSSDGESNEAGQEESGSKVGSLRKADEVRELSVTIIASDSLRDVSVEVTGSDWSDSDEWSGSRIKSQRVRGADATSQCDDQPVSRRQDALASVDDVELMTLANQMAEPWCTDDICTAALKDVADACKGIFDMKQRASSAKKHIQNDGQQEIVEDYIAGVLGAPSAMVSFLAVGDFWNSEVQSGDKDTQGKFEVNRIQNRASVVNGQARRLHRLKSEMTFVAAERDATEKMYYVQTVNSFDDAGRKMNKQRGVPQVESESLDSSVIFQQGAGNAVGQVAEIDEEILYYDSDPEHSRERKNRGPRRAYADRLNSIEATRARRKILSGISINRLCSGRRWKKMDDSLCTEIIEAMKNEKMTLMWHPTQTKQFPNRTPVCVKVWIESGVYLIDGTFLLPKLTWIPMYERHLHSKLLNVATECPERLDLLDVCRVRECERVDRRLHPYARPDRSFVIQLQNDVFLFETQSTEERGRVVNGLKLVIARLASLLMLRDLRAVEEFFGGGSVPGEAPAWAQSGKGDDANPGDNLDE